MNLSQSETRIVTLKQNLEALLREYAENDTRHRVFMREVLQDERCPSLSVILRIFEVKTFDEVLRALELWPEHPTEEELIWSLRRFYIEHQRVPTQHDAAEGDLPYSKHAYTRKFKSWNNALVAAGLPCRKARGGWAHHDPRWDNVTKDEVIAYLRLTFGEEGKLPTIETYKKGGYLYPVCVLIRLFQTWAEMAEAAHLRLTSQDRIPDEEILCEFERLYGDTRTLPTVAAYIESNPKYSYALCIQRFISWRELGRRLGYRLASGRSDDGYDPDNTVEPEADPVNTFEPGVDPADCSNVA